MDDPILVVIRGLPGSGKSTLARRFAGAGFVHYESDQHFYRNGRYCYKPEEQQLAHDTCRLNAETALAGGQNVVVSNTFVTLAEIRLYREMARFRRARFIVLVTHGQWQNNHDIQPWQIENMMRRWQPLTKEIAINALHISSMSIDAMLGQAQEV